MSLRRTVLPSGLRIVTEAVPEVRSAAFGIWVNVGSRDEDARSAGASHFLEHLLFKGTKRRSSLEISSAIESVGGEMNAFTTKEYTCFYARVIDTDLPMAIDVISDLITASLCRPEDVDAERNVVLEEIAMRDDDPSDLVHEVFAESFYGKNALARSILGSVETIKKIKRDAIFDYYQKRYRPDQIVVSVSGNIKHRKVIAAVESALSRDGFLDRASAPEIRKSEPFHRAKGSVGLLAKRVNRLIYSSGFLQWIEMIREDLQLACSQRLSAAGCLRDSSRKFVRNAVLLILFTPMHNNSRGRDI